MADGAAKNIPFVSVAGATVAQRAAAAVAAAAAARLEAHDNYPSSRFGRGGSRGRGRGGERAADEDVGSDDSDDDDMEIQGITFEAFSEAPPVPVHTEKHHGHREGGGWDGRGGGRGRNSASSSTAGINMASGSSSEEERDSDSSDGDDDGNGDGSMTPPPPGGRGRGRSTRGGRGNRAGASRASSTRPRTEEYKYSSGSGSEQSDSTESFDDAASNSEAVRHNDTDDASDAELPYSSSDPAEPSSPSESDTSSDDSDDPEYRPSAGKTATPRRRIARKAPVASSARGKGKGKAVAQEHRQRSQDAARAANAARILAENRRVTTEKLAQQVLASAGGGGAAAAAVAKSAIARASYNQNPNNGKKKTGLFGVSYINGEWHARIFRNKNHVSLGIFPSKEAAAQAYAAEVEKDARDFAARDAVLRSGRVSPGWTSLPTTSPGGGGGGGGGGAGAPTSSATWTMQSKFEPLLKRTGLRRGTKLKARGSDGEWAKARIDDFDLRKGQIKVHYLSWAATHDEWIPLQSHRLDLASGNITWPDPGAMGIGGEHASFKGNGKVPGAVAIGSSGRLSVAGEEGSLYPPPKGIPGYAAAVKTLLNAGTLAAHASTSGYIGVFKNYTDPTKFEAKIYLNRSYEYLGVFSTKEEAAAAYDIAARLYGKRMNYTQTRVAKPQTQADIEELPSLPTEWLGIRKIGNKYRSEIVDDGMKLHIGYFSTPEEAARAYDTEARKAPGAVLNFLQNGRPNPARLPSLGKLQPGHGLAPAHRTGEVGGVGATNRPAIVDPISQDQHNNYRGVEAKGDFWRARIHFGNGRRKHLGQWSSPELAAQAYDNEARKYPEKVVNFPHNQAEVAAKLAADKAHRNDKRRRQMMSSSGAPLPRPAQRQKKSSGGSAGGGGGGGAGGAGAASSASKGSRIRRLEAVKREALAALASASSASPSPSPSPSLSRAHRYAHSSSKVTPSASAHLHRAASSYVSNTNSKASSASNQHAHASASTASRSGSGSGSGSGSQARRLIVRQKARAGIEGMLPDVFVEESTVGEESESAESSEEEEGEALELEPGTEIEAQDKHGQSWYPCKVVRFLEKKKVGTCVRVHYLGWGDRYDEEIELTSKRMRPTGGRAGVVCIKGGGGSSSKAGKGGGRGKQTRNRSTEKDSNSQKQRHYANLRNFTDSTVVKSKVPSVYSELNVPIYCQPKTKDLVAHYFTTGWEHGVIEKKGSGRLPYTVYYKWGGGERLKHALPEDGYNSIWCLLR